MYIYTYLQDGPYNAPQAYDNHGYSVVTKRPSLKLSKQVNQVISHISSRNIPSQIIVHSSYSHSCGTIQKTCKKSLNTSSQH